MNGVTVLNIWTEQIGGGLGMYLGAVIAAIMTAILFLGVIIGIKEVDIHVIPCFILCILFGFLCYSCWSDRVPRYQERQLVTIDDTVNFNDFNERYKIIKQEGEVFTITERED